MSEPKEPGKKETATGRYVYDKKLAKVIKISDDIPGLKKASGSGEAGCPMNPGSHNCGGCCRG